MPDLDALRALLPALGDFDTLAAKFATTGGGSATDFAAWLAVRGLITPTELRDALALLDEEVQLVDEPTSQVPRMLGLIGKGAMGEVNAARDEGLQRTVAVKRMDARHAKDPVLRSRFFAEVQVTAQLDHPGVVPVYTLEQGSDGVPAYSMKLVRGRTLRELLAAERGGAQRGEPAEHDLIARLDLFREVCAPMACAHARGVMHRDLKPDNVMIGKYNDVYVMDWGLARRIGAASRRIEDSDEEVTRVGAMVGTPAYMSPEQVAGENVTLDARTDVFALGLLLYEIVTLRRAREGFEGMDLLAAAARGEVGVMTHIAPHERVPRELVAVVRRATAFMPDDRYAGADALADDVRRYLRGDAVLAERDTPLQSGARWIARHRELSAAVGLSLVLLVFLVAAVGIAGAGAAFDAAEERTRAHAERVEAVLATVSGQGVAIDRELLRYEGLLLGLASAAELALQVPPVQRPIYPGDWERDGPPDLAFARVYDELASFDFIDIGYAEGVDPRSAERRVLQLASLRPALARVLVESHSRTSTLLSPARQRALVLDEGTPSPWAYVTLEEGVIVGLPGTADPYPPGYDPRARPWYLRARDQHSPSWGAVYLDESGMGLLLDCGMGLFDQRGALLGVAAMDVSVAWLVDALLDPPGLDGVEAYLVDEKGRVVVQSRLKDRARTGKDYEPPVLPWPQVVAGGSSGRGTATMETDAGDLLAWTRLRTVPWTYLVVGPKRTMEGN